MNHYSQSEETSSFCRVRKPPGGDTNDIFDLEVRQKLQKDQKTYVLETGSDSQKLDKEDSVELTTDAPVVDSESQLTEEINDQKTPPLIVLDKENINVLLEDEDPSVQGKLANFTKKTDEISSEGNLKKKAVSDELKASKMKKHVLHNPITGEMSEMEMSQPLKLKDCSNMMPQSHDIHSKDTADFGLSRPSIRVRQPPGGKSSHIFM